MLPARGLQQGDEMADEAADGFDSLGLSDEVVRTLKDLGYEAPTPIQRATIPALLEGRDLVGQAQTGTGKTAAFALPLIEKIDPGDKQTQALILAPTRELAVQVAEAVHSYAKSSPQIHVLPIYGGAPIVPQLKRLERGVQIVVGTPGRIIDHLDRRSLDLSSIRMLVLDEADEMLRMGFIDDVERILRDTPEERQVALFSATMPAEIRRIAERYLKNPVNVAIEQRSMAAPAIDQRFLNVSEQQKLEALQQILELEPSEGVLIFRRTKNGAAELAEKLEARGFSAQPMHGDMTQSLRESVIRRLKGGQIEIVVATDVAARGLDVEQITHVVNYDIPYDVEAYVHRIGRTGRAGRSGVATLFVTPRERRMLREIERHTKSVIQPMKMPTRADVAARRIAVLKDGLRAEVEKGDLDLYLQLVEEMVDEGTIEISDLAAAAIRIANGSRSLAPEPEPRPAPQDYAPRAERPRPSGSRPKERPSAGGDRKRPQRGAEGPRTQLVLSIGRDDGVRPADLVGALANEGGIPGREIGPIEILDDRSHVMVPAEMAGEAVGAMKNAMIRGRRLDVKVGTGGAGARPGQDRDSRPPVRKTFAETPRRSTRPGGSGKPAGRFSSSAPAAKRSSTGTSRFGTRSEGSPERRPSSPAAPSRFGDKKAGPKRPFYADVNERPKRVKPGRERDDLTSGKPAGKKADRAAPKKPRGKR